MSRTFPEVVATLAPTWIKRRLSELGRSDDETPLRAELFGADQMEQHGRILADTHVLGGSGRSDWLLDRLDENQQKVIETCSLLTATAKSGMPVAPAGEWLLDNYYLIEEQIRTAKNHLPRGYSRQLPLLAQGPSRNLPRVYDLALEAIAHGDGHLNMETLARFVAAYQSVTPLTLGELWAIPIMLRIALIENLRRVSARIRYARTCRNQAQEWANEMIEIEQSDPKSLILVVADMARSNPPMVGPFVAELARQLRGQGPTLALPLTWVEQRLAESSQTIDQLVLSENQGQAADQVSISNTIGSLRFLGATDWRVFVEAMSIVERVLVEDPGSVYRLMDFGTRDSYRQVIDTLARRSPLSETEVARAAVHLAHVARHGANPDAGAPSNAAGNAPIDPPLAGHADTALDSATNPDAENSSASSAEVLPDRAAHVGYYLQGDGLAQLEKTVKARMPLGLRLRRAFAASPLAVYLGSIVIITELIAGLLFNYARGHDVNDGYAVILLVLLVVAASQVACALTNWGATLSVSPKRLPRMDFSKGLPTTCRALVVMPTLLDSPEAIDELLESIEVCFLGNREELLHFGLLTDFRDAATEAQDDDGPLLMQVQRGIEALNEKYRTSRNDRFYLFHRPRRWNPSERVWMGYERKRGKLTELNALLRGTGADRFAAIVGDVTALTTVRYVITLDSDTQLPRDAARELVSVMAHPLNLPVIDAATRRVTRGYGILQPRVASSLIDPERSRYAELCGGDPGIDPYTRAVSDVYQDLFGEGSYIGKGIYDVDAFEATLHGRFPENRILSHDLLEGSYARSGLLSDVNLFEAYPARHDVDVKRQWRWIRGDWQIAQWMMPRVPVADGHKVKNPLSALSRWKIFDNLRRSLANAALMLLALFAWFLLPHPWFWSAMVVAAILAVPLLIGSVDFLRRPENGYGHRHGLERVRALGRHFAMGTFRLAVLPYDVVFSVDAILRTFWRLSVSHRDLLGWAASASFQRQESETLIESYTAMWFSPVYSVGVAALLATIRPDALVAATPLLVLWFFAPAAVWWVGRPLGDGEARLGPSELLFLRKTARKTWSFFERFVSPEDNWLPPDNYQEDPGAKVAHRTSPTNIGLALLANLAACEFGYLSIAALLERTANTFATLLKLERYQGHFYNWYDTQSLQPLPPRYISSVDSGNLAGHLLTLRVGLLALPDRRIIEPRVFEGLADTLAVVADLVPTNRPGALVAMQGQVDAACALRPDTLSELLRRLERMESSARTLQSALAASHQVGAQAWAEALERQCEDAIAELKAVAPWVTLDAPPDATLREGVFARLDQIPTLREVSLYPLDFMAAIDARMAGALNEAQRSWLSGLREAVAKGASFALERIDASTRLANQASDFSLIEFDFLYDHSRHLLAIGYNVDERRPDNAYYDLLASEARLSTFVGVAQGQLPQESWFALGRTRTNVGGEPVLVSWSGSMFEYLMPMLVMPSYDGSLLKQACHAAVTRQISYGDQCALPWGVSECAYCTIDASLNYQYRAFGVPGLGLQRGLGEDSIVAPYASALALMVTPEAACLNLQRLAGMGLAGEFGFYESIDFTASRLGRGQTSAIVKTFMAHHQGMVLLALTYALLDRPMQRFFEADPMLRSTLLLLQERVPKHAVFHGIVGDMPEVPGMAGTAETTLRAAIGPDTATPEVNLLSNGRYHLMITNAGGGYSRWKDMAVTRWREDGTSDAWGSFIYLRDVMSSEFWSAAHQPTLKAAQSYEATFSEGRAEFRRRDFDYETYSQIVVSPEDDLEVRRVRVTNHARVPRTVEVTSYAEVVLAGQDADIGQTAFSNLFVETEIVKNRRAILCTRRRRAASEAAPWMFHLLATHGAQVDTISYETDRMRFVGRGRSSAHPEALDSIEALSGSDGSVLDPIASIRCRILLEAGQSATLDFVTGAADTRELCQNLVEKYQDRHLVDRVFDVAGTHSNIALRQINATEADAQLYTRLAGSVLYANPALRAEPSILVQNRRGQSGLWGYTISGDLPIVLLRIANAAQIDLARQMIQCHAYWKLKGLAVDLVIWNEDHDGYRQQLQDLIIGLISNGGEANALDRRGGIYVRPADQIAADDRILMQAVARAILVDTRGTLAEQLTRRPYPEKRAPRLTIARTARSDAMYLTPAPERAAPAVILANPLGGFAPDGREYLITTTAKERTPLPWVNVLANANFGSVITEAGGAYTWNQNAHEYRLTPWSDDAVGASNGEAFYLRDEESGQFWSPAPWPAPDGAPYLTRHGFGYSVFEHAQGGIRSELWIYVDAEDPVKFAVLKVRNQSGRARHLSATGYVEWVLGDTRNRSAMHIVTEIDAASGALFATNPYNSEFSGSVAFLDVDDTSRTLTGDRCEFLGRNGRLASPDAMLRTRLSGRLGAALDPCGAIHVPFEIADGAEREIIFRLGAGTSLEAARKLVARLRRTGSARAALERVRQSWSSILGAVRVETPDTALNVLANGWLIYQTLACRLWGRSGYSQSGGAFGFRDQLQDAMALVHTRPQLLREQIVRCAERQYPQGDVQHWWHPPQGRGVRTRCSDDYLWLVFATCRYIKASGDTGVLDESLQFLEGRPLGPDEESYYDLPQRAAAPAALYEHCTRAINYGLRFGDHGLPLMGSGDWNDGMNQVGIHGKGESVWLAFFLYQILTEFSALAEGRNDSVFATTCQSEAERLRANIAAHGWDGAWYRRAYFDDGTPLGSSVNEECSIDSIAQSWSVLSGAGDTARSALAMDSLDDRLVHRPEKLIQLLDPPFDHSSLDPGYIKGYVPGVRENGGQYTHSAVWAAMAFAAQGDGVRAWELLEMINPVNHSLSAEATARYRAEPYVVAGDVYARAPHTGRAGWTWYTGSAGWLYRLIIESLFGLSLDRGRLVFAPRLPDGWTAFKVDYRYRETLYQIAFTQSLVAAGEQTLLSVVLDGVDAQADSIALADDRVVHRVEVTIRRYAYAARAAGRTPIPPAVPAAAAPNPDAAQTSVAVRLPARSDFASTAPMMIQTRQSASETSVAPAQARAASAPQPQPVAPPGPAGPPANPPPAGQPPGTPPIVPPTTPPEIPIGLPPSGVPPLMPPSPLPGVGPATGSGAPKLPRDGAVPARGEFDENVLP